MKADALRLITANAAYYAELGPALAIPADSERTKAVDLEEVADATGMDVRGATVRGTGDGPRVVTYVFVKRNQDGSEGRSGKGMIPYGELKRSQRAYEQARKVKLDASKAARASGGSEAQFGEDPRVSALTSEIERLERELKARESAPSLPEPLGGYADLSVDEVSSAINAVDDPVEREILKRSVRAYEQELKGDKARKGVLHATEPVSLVPADDSGSE